MAMGFHSLALNENLPVGFFAREWSRQFRPLYEEDRKGTSI
jgi:hypothetical protein